MTYTLRPPSQLEQRADKLRSELVWRSWDLAHSEHFRRWLADKDRDYDRPYVTGLAPTWIWRGLGFLAHRWGFGLETKDLGHIDGSANGNTDMVTINPHRPPLHQLLTLAHEIMHIAMGHVYDRSYDVRRGEREVQAESGAFILLGLLGLDTTDESVLYVTRWSYDQPYVVTSEASMGIHAALGIYEHLVWCRPSPEERQSARLDLPWGGVGDAA